MMMPIFQTSTYVQDGVGGHKGYEYARTGNPTRTALETCLASFGGSDPRDLFLLGLRGYEQHDSHVAPL